MRNRTTLRGLRHRTRRPAPPEVPEPWWKRHARVLWLGAGIPVIGAVATAIALQLLGLGGETEPSPASAPGAASSGGTPTAPFVVTARQENDAGCTALPHRVSSPQDRADLVSGGDADAVVRRNRGARVGELRVGLTLEGGASSLTVTSIGIRPTSPRAVGPLAGTLVCEPDAGGEAKIQLYADMDSPDPVFLTGRGSAREYFRENVVTLGPGEQVNLSATFSSEKGSREFELLVRYVRNGKEGAVPVPAPRGGRYAVTGFATRYGDVYEGSDGGVYRRLDGSRPCRWAPRSPGC
ncbi:hypothetical protein NPS70_17410 [Streptomyces sp. C10-9-1]|uniref:hypothetical protein n=1 Tax=Streptomyces sp. C10-9-1 TaxID=1859285 RepID=UPI0021123F26|nr:hypothetical protein [Streptomyces sp. C10-9-1]MCQ6554958.1 hypothetical protein [Streptomyces sp. C10-9-1]